MDDELNDTSKRRQKVRISNCVGYIRNRVVGRTESIVFLPHHIGTRKGRGVERHLKNEGKRFVFLTV